MSSVDQTEIAVLRELEIAIPAFNATRYLSAAGLVILLYDHLLLLGEEKRLIWSAKPTWSKYLFLVNRYTVPIFHIITIHLTSGLSTAGLSTFFCQTWLSIASFLLVSNLGVANVFVVHRVYALWGHNRQILRVLVWSFCVVYIATYVAAGFAITEMIPNISYSPIVRMCILDQRPRIYLPFALPIAFDILLFILTCWNALDRPRSMRTALTKQLYLDGAVYFVALLSLRLFNIFILLFANPAYIQLGIYFIWSMVTTLVNRMLISISAAAEDPDSHVHDVSGRESPFRRLDTPFQYVDAPFDLAEPDTKSIDGGNFIDMSFRGKELPLRSPKTHRGLSF